MRDCGCTDDIFIFITDCFASRFWLFFFSLSNSYAKFVHLKLMVLRLFYMCTFAFMALPLTESFAKNEFPSVVVACEVGARAVSAHFKSSYSSLVIKN